MNSRIASIAVFLFALSSLFAERQPYERYQSIVDRQMFGRPPAGFDPTVPASAVSKSDQKELTKEQEVLKSAVHFSAINVTPDGDTAVGFTDNADPKMPMHYYLKVGEVRNGWKVLEADPVNATMTIEKNDIQVSLSLGANSANSAATKAKPSAADAAPAAKRLPLLGRRSGLQHGANASEGGKQKLLGSSLRQRRAAIAKERQEAAEKERARQEAEREERRQELEAMKEELRQQREAVEQARAEREAEREAQRAKQEQHQTETHEENNL